MDVTVTSICITRSMLSPDVFGLDRVFHGAAGCHNDNFTCAYWTWSTKAVHNLGLESGSMMQVDVTVTAKADQPWLWGLQSAVEAIFIAQAKDDILAFLEYCLRLFKELQRTLQVLVHDQCMTTADISD